MLQVYNFRRPEWNALYSESPSILRVLFFCVDIVYTNRYHYSMSTLHVRLDDKRKKKAQKILLGLGLDLSQAVRLFIHQICITEGVPLQILTENGLSVEEEDMLLRDSHAAHAGKGVQRYKNVDDLFRSAYEATDNRHASTV